MNVIDITNEEIEGPITSWLMQKYIGEEVILRITNDQLLDMCADESELVYDEIDKDGNTTTHFGAFHLEVTNPKTYVIAGTKHEALRFCKRHNVQPYSRDTRLISSAEVTRGCVIEPQDKVYLLPNAKYMRNWEDLVISFIPAGINLNEHEVTYS